MATTLPPVTDEDISVIVARWRPLVPLIQAQTPPEPFMDALAQVPCDEGTGVLVQAVLDVGVCIGKILQLQAELAAARRAPRKGY